MDGIHDLGGKHGFGKVRHAPAEPVFKAHWEGAVFAMVRAGAGSGAWNNSDRFRHAVERIDPVAYLSHGYYGRWLGGIEALLCEAGVITRQELDDRVAAAGGDPEALIAARPQAAPDPMGERTAAGNDRVGVDLPRFETGDRVITATTVKAGHTRLPAYARGKRGVITRQHGMWVYPDTSAHGQGECPCHLYTVEFTGPELWGGGDTEMVVSLDLFEPYLELSRD